MPSWPRLIAEALGVPYGEHGSWERRIAEGIEAFNGGDVGALDTGSVWLGRLWRALESRPEFRGRTWQKLLAGGGWRELLAAIEEQPEPPWNPADLGAKLRAWWDAEDPTSFTLAGGLVSGWADQVGAYAAIQGLSASKPIYAADSFGGRPGVTFDGLDDCLTVEPAPASIPIGEDSCEIWALVDQTALSSAAGQRQIVTYGSATNDRRMIYRDVASSENRFRAVGTRSTNGVVASENTIAFFGRHVVRGIWDGGQMIAEIDGVQSAPTALLPLTTGARLRLGASPLSSANAFFQGIKNSALIVAPLDSDEATALRDFLQARIAGG